MRTVAVSETGFGASLRTFLGGRKGLKFTRSVSGADRAPRRGTTKLQRPSSTVQRLLDNENIDKIIDDLVREQTEQSYQYPTTIMGYMAGDSTLGGGGGSEGGLGKRSSGMYSGPPASDHDCKDWLCPHSHCWKCNDCPECIE